MAPPVIWATMQAAILSATSNVLAQMLKAYRSEEPFRLNLVPVMHFVVFTILSCPPNFFWQEYIEEKYPGYTAGIDGQRTLNKQNTVRKLFLDQTLGAAVNTALFVAGMAAFKGKDRAAIMRDCRRDVWPLMVSGWKIWPLVSVFNFTFVPVQRRIVVGSFFGLFWGIYLSLFVAARPAPLPLTSSSSGILT